MKFHWQISAGEFFELLRPAALLVSALLSTWVLASARRWSFHNFVATGWALGTFLLPFVVLPLYLIARASKKRRARSTKAESQRSSKVSTELAGPVAGRRFVLPAVYLLLLLSLLGLYLYRDYNSVDAHLARAAQAKVAGRPATTIREYRAALTLEDNPHTHKLLGIELADANQSAQALREFRLAESGGEPDESLPFRMGQLLDAVGNHAEAMTEYQKFLEGQMCLQSLPDDRCRSARIRMQSSLLK